MVTDTVVFHKNPETPLGKYELRTGMYWLPTGGRLMMTDATGDSILLTTVQDVR